MKKFADKMRRDEQNLMFYEALQYSLLYLDMQFKPAYWMGKNQYFGL